MPRLTEAELLRKELQRTLRVVVRLAANNAVYRTLNKVEQDALAEFDRRLAAGEPYTLDTSTLLRSTTKALQAVNLEAE